MIITKWKLQFSLISSFYCYLVRGLSPESCLEICLEPLKFVMQGLGAYKPLAYKPTPTTPANLFARPFTCPRTELTPRISSTYQQTPFKFYLLQESD